MADDRGQLGLHVVMVKQRAAGAGSERNEDVDVALRAEVVAQDRAEQRKFGDPPAPAEPLNGRAIDGQVGSHLFTILVLRTTSGKGKPVAPADLRGSAALQSATRSSHF